LKYQLAQWLGRQFPAAPVIAPMSSDLFDWAAVV